MDPTFFFSEMGTYSIQPSVLEGILEEQEKAEMCKMRRDHFINA